MGFVFYTQGLGMPLLAVIAGSAGLYICTVTVSLIPVIAAGVVGLAGMAGATYALLTR